MISFASGSDRLRRATGIVQGNANYTCVFWARLMANVSGGNFLAYFSQQNATQWAGIFGDINTNNALVDIEGGGSAATTDIDLTLLQWVPFAYVRNGTSHSFYADGVLVGSATLDISAVTFTEQMLGNDGFGSAACQIMYFREWNTVLTLAEMLLEWNSPTVVKIPNLWSNVPLLTNANDISGNGRDFTVIGAPTFGTGPTPIPLTNTSSGTAYNITSALPQEFVQIVHDSGITNDSWYKYTVVSGINEIGAFAWGGTPISGGYFPKIIPYEDGVFGGPYLGVFSVADKPIQIPVLVGSTYYFKAQKGSYIAGVTNPSPAVLFTSFVASPTTTQSSGDIFVNDDTEEFPSIIISSATDYLTKKFLQNMPAGEAGDIVSNGNFLLEDIDTDDYKLFDKNGNLLITYPSFTTFGYNIRKNLTADAFYLTEIRNSLSAALTLKKISNVGVELSSVTVTGVTRAEGIAVNSAQTILYLTRSTNSQPVKRWDMVGGALTTDLVAGVTNYRMQDLLVLADDSIVAIYFKLSAPQDIFARRFNAAGTTLNTYALNAYASIGSVSLTPRLAYAIDDPTYFWVYMQSATLGRGFAKFLKIRSTDGVVLTERNHLTFEFGGNQGSNYTINPNARFGPSESCPFFILTEAATNSIQVIKVSEPSSPAQSFDFTTSGGLSPSTFSLSHGQSQVFSGLANGTYSIIETPLSGWSVEYQVSDGSPNTAINLSGGENVTVTVINTKDANERSGIYKIVPDKRNDTLWDDLEAETTTDVKIPNPFAKSALLGE